MKTILKTCLFLCVLVLGFFCSLAPQAFAQVDYESINQINDTNWVRWFDDSLGYVYDSHGCLHFTPSDVYLLYKTIPPGLMLTIKKYQLKEGEPPYNLMQVPYLIDKATTPQEVAKLAATFKTYKTELVVYPSLDTLIILVNGGPYAKVTTLAGPRQDYLMAFDVEKGNPVVWDSVLTTPTDPGSYQLLRWTDHYLSNTYYQNTIVPFGAWLRKINGRWSYQDNGRWFKLPQPVVDDLKRPQEGRQYNYYDLNVDSSGQLVAGRYAGHDFGKYVLLWTTDGKNYYPEMGYSSGQLVYEQVILVKDLVNLLTAAGEDDLNSVISQDENFKFYRQLAEFKSSGGKKMPDKADRTLLAEYKLFKNLDLTEADKQLLDGRLVKALGEYREERLPRDQRARWESLGLYNYLRVNSLVIDKQAGWYEKIQKDWDKLKALRQKLRTDFDQMGVLSVENRQNLVEGWLTDRLEFKLAAPPKQAKNVANLSFSEFFRPDDTTQAFNDREKAVMIEKIKKAVKGEDKGLNLAVVDALNKYNFGVLLNDIIGDLYKSHGCMHVSPRNMTFLSHILPIGAAMKVHKYTDRISAEAVNNIPYLADLVNFSDDLDKLKSKFAVTAEVDIEVYPYSGDWLIYLQNKPFTRLTIRGGPQTKYYLVQGRDEKGKPIFEPHLAYPTTPGNYWIFKKVDNYVSGIYRDQTVIPQGGLIKWVKEKNKWVFQDEAGNWKEITPALAEDLKQPADKQAYTYYDVAQSSGEVVSMRWGSHPFGRGPIEISADKRTMWPELVHTSGDLMMEERQLVNELIRILTAPQDNLDDCLPYSQNFELYKACFDFTANPGRTDLIQPKERAAYRLYFNLSLTASEEALLPLDVIAANKVLRNKPLSEGEIKVLLNEGIAYRRAGELKLNMEKILGLQFDTYQYVVTIQKYAHHYETLKRRWAELSSLRSALLKDFNNFVLKDPALFQNFMRELMLKRNRLERLTQQDALQILNGML